MIEEKRWSLQQIAFFLFSQWCSLRNTADLLKFMFNKFRSITALETVCCHNDVPQRLRGEWKGGSFRFYIWRLKVKQTLFFFSSLKEVGIIADRRYHHSVRTWKTREKSVAGEKSFTTCQILELKFSNASDFEKKINSASDFEFQKLQRVRLRVNFFQRVRFQINFSDTRQILNWMFYNLLDFQCTSSAVCHVFMG